MKTIPPLLVLLAIIAFFTPWFAIWMVAGRELDQERHWRVSIDSIHQEAFQIGGADRDWKRQNTERMNEVFASIVESRRHTVGIINFVLGVSWVSSAALVGCAILLNKNNKKK